MGGDEVFTISPDEYAWFVRTVRDIVRAAGKQVVGWQEIARRCPARRRRAVLGHPARARAVRGGRGRWGEGAALARFAGLPRHEVRRVDRARARVGRAHRAARRLRLGADRAHHRASCDSIIGVEATVWTETITTPDELFFMLLPRLAPLPRWRGRRPTGLESFRVGSPVRPAAGTRRARVVSQPAGRLVAVRSSWAATCARARTRTTRPAPSTVG